MGSRTIPFISSNARKRASNDGHRSFNAEIANSVSSKFAETSTAGAAYSPLQLDRIPI
jgi:hypothetical protein